MERSEPRTGVRADPLKDDPFDWFLRIPNRMELLRPLRALLQSTCEFHGVDEEATQEVLLVVSEIVNNSIEHVAGRGPEGYHEVDLRFGIGGGRIVGVVLDEGEGGIEQTDFDGASSPSLDNDRGRGLFLIKAYVDELSVRPRDGVGTEIRFVKRLGDGKGEGAA
jgi:anti-sigma regulatory factor (Ser/Thr protein kinase)